jgi:excisionase family DNA binding protein
MALPAPAFSATTESEEVPQMTLDHQPDSPTSPVPLLLTVQQAAEMLGIGRSTIYELLAAGELRSIKLGGSRRIPVSAVREYVERLLARGLQANWPSRSAPNLAPER